MAVNSNLAIQSPARRTAPRPGSARQMVDRRRTQQGELNVDRLMARVEASNQALRDRMEQLIDGVDSRLSRIEHDVATGSLERSQLMTAIAEVRRDLGENRAATELLKVDLDQHKKIERLSRVAATLSFADWFKSIGRWQKGVAAVSSAGLLFWVIKEAPAVIRFLNSLGHGIAAFWQGMGK